MALVYLIQNLDLLFIGDVLNSRIRLNYCCHGMINTRSL